MLVIEAYYPNWRNLDVHESSSGSSATSLKLKRHCKKYTPSQFNPDRSFGVVINECRNEKLESQTFADASFDIVVTQDVIEYVYLPQSAFCEIARTLRQGGAHIFTVPIINRHRKREVWAAMGDNGKPMFLNSEKYYSNPIDPNGSPVTMHWGFDILDFIRVHGGLETSVEYIDSLEFGIRAEVIEVW